MRRLLVGCVLASAGVAHADDVHDVFGFDKKKPATSQPAKNEDAHDVFGFTKKKTQEAVDCSDGTAFGCVNASDPLDEHDTPYSLASWLASSYLLTLPVADATHEQVAHYALGVSRDEAGPSFAGATGLENRWTVNGAPADTLRLGVADTRLPLPFISGMWVTNGGFTARDRVSTGGMIDAELKSGTDTHELDVRAYGSWTADPRRRPIAPATYYPRRGTFEDGPTASASLVATGPFALLGDALGGKGWYAAGVAPYLDTTKFTWRAATLVDVDADGIPDGFPGVVALDPITTYSRTPLTYRVPTFARVGLDRGVHHLDLTVVGAAASDVRYLFDSTLQAAGVNGRTIEGDAIATWRGTWKSTRARAQLAWHRSMRHEWARDPRAADIPQLLSTYVPETLPEDQALADACNDDPAIDRLPSVPNCPVPLLSGWFYSGGAGPLTDVTGDRPSITADIAHKTGNHVVRAGATGEDTRLVTATRYTGGAQIRSLFPGYTATRQFVDPDAVCQSTPGSPCPTVDESVLRWRTRYTAAYLEDTWHADPNVTFDGGLRWELMWVGTVLHFSDEFAPRAGISWDPAGKGRSRVWASAGRTYAMLPAGLGSTILSRDRTVDNTKSQFGEGRLVDTGAVFSVAPDVKPIAQDEVTVGAEAALAKTVRATIWGQGRWLRDALDTTTAGFDNPGRFGGTPAIRETGLVAAELATAPTATLVLRVGYMYGRTIGSWTGAFDPRQGAVLYAGTDFNASSQGQLGLLPTDIGHRTYIEAQRSGHVGPVKLAFATRLTTASGRPRSVLGDSEDGIIFVIPRGTNGRDPLVTQANIRLAASWHDFDITLDLFNVFNRHTAQLTDEVFTAPDSGTVRPIDHGTTADLPFLKTDAGAAVLRSQTFGVGTELQPPFSAFLGIHRSI